MGAAVSVPQGENADEVLAQQCVDPEYHSDVSEDVAEASDGEDAALSSAAVVNPKASSAASAAKVKAKAQGKAKTKAKAKASAKAVAGTPSSRNSSDSSSSESSSSSSDSSS